MRQKLFLNSLVWAGTVLASAVILKGTDLFMPMLLVLLMGAVASNAMVARH